MVFPAVSLSLPSGGEAVTFAVLMMWSPSTFACVSVWLPVQEIISSEGQNFPGTTTLAPKSDETAGVGKVRHHEGKSLGHVNVRTGQAACLTLVPRYYRVALKQEW